MSDHPIQLRRGLWLPRAAEGFAPLEAVRGCNPVPQPGVELFRDWLLARAGGVDMGIVRGCSGSASSKHHEGRAWDWGTPTDAGDEVWRQLAADDFELARRAGLRTMIWALPGAGSTSKWGRLPTIWIAGREPCPYAWDGRSGHFDHIHFGFGWAGARGETSLYEAIDIARQRQTDADDRQSQTTGVQTSLPRLPGLSETTAPFRRALVKAAMDLAIEPDYLAAVIGFETAGQWRASTRNPWSGATGLIQWTAPTARAVHGVSLDQLAAMSEIDQLSLVVEYMRRAGLPAGAFFRDVYLAVFAPAFVGAEPDQVLYAMPTKAYQQNRGLDRDTDGAITAAEAAAGPAALLAKHQDDPRISVEL